MPECTINFRYSCLILYPNQINYYCKEASLLLSPSVPVPGNIQNQYIKSSVFNDKFQRLNFLRHRLKNSTYR